MRFGDGVAIASLCHAKSWQNDGIADKQNILVAFDAMDLTQGRSFAFLPEWQE
jgi:hypothetical protein